MANQWSQGSTYEPGNIQAQQQKAASGWGAKSTTSGWGGAAQQQPQQPQQQAPASGWGAAPQQQQAPTSGWGGAPQQPQQQAQTSGWGGAPQQPQPQSQPQQQQQPQAEPDQTGQMEQKPSFLKKYGIRVTAFAFAGIVIAILGIFIFSHGRDKNKEIMENPGSYEDPLATQPSPMEGGDDFDSFLQDLTPAFQYTDEEVATLRAWGYTGDEIEAFEAEEADVTTLVNQSKEAQEKARETLSNPESEEYKTLLNQTWVGQPAISIPEASDDMAYNLSYNEYTLNADYEKIPAHGTNLFLKVYLDASKERYYFMECPLDLYAALPDYGNIVVHYRTVSYGDATVIYGMENVTVG